MGFFIGYYSTFSFWGVGIGVLLKSPAPPEKSTVHLYGSMYPATHSKRRGEGAVFPDVSRPSVSLEKHRRGELRNRHVLEAGSLRNKTDARDRPTDAAKRLVRTKEGARGWEMSEAGRLVQKDAASKGLIAVRS